MSDYSDKPTLSEGALFVAFDEIMGCIVNLNYFQPLVTANLTMQLEKPVSLNKKCALYFRTEMDPREPHSRRVFTSSKVFALEEKISNDDVEKIPFCWEMIASATSIFVLLPKPKI